MSQRTHFEGGSLPSWLTSFVSGTGSVSQSDSEEVCSFPANHDAAGFYWNTKVDLTKRTLIRCAVRYDSLVSGVGTHTLHLLFGASFPGPDTFANLNNATISYVAGFTTAGAQYLHARHFTSGGSNLRWNRATEAWESGTPASTGKLSADDYILLTLEIDGPNRKFRYGFVHQSDDTSGAFTVDQGPKLVGHTDWVVIDDTRGGATTDLWVSFGFPYTDLSQTGTQTYEWIDLADNSTESGLTNVRTGSGGAWRIRSNITYFSDLGIAMMPYDRNLVAIDVGAGGSWDDQETKDKTQAADPGTSTIHHGIYQGYDGTNRRLGQAVSTDGGYTWTKFGQVLDVSGTDEANLFTPHLYYDPADPDPDWRWKCLYMGQSSAAGNPQRIYLMTAPVDTGSGDMRPSTTWTRRGLVLDLGAASDFDESGVYNPVVVWLGGTLYLFYGGRSTSASPISWKVGRATGTISSTGISMTRVSTSPVISRSTLAQVLTDGLDNTRDSAVSDETGFDQDRFVIVGNSTTDQDHWSPTRVRKTATGHLYFYHKLRSFTAGTSPEVQPLDGGSIDPHNIRLVGSEYWFITCPYGPFLGSPSSYVAYCEMTGLWKAAALLDAPVLDNFSTPLASHVVDTVLPGNGSYENPALATNPAPDVVLTADLAISAAVSAELTTGIALTTAPSVSVGLAAELTTGVQLATDLGVAVALAADLTTAIALEATLGATAGLAAELTVGAGLTTTLASTVTAAADLSTGIPLAATLAGTVALSAALSTGIQLVASAGATVTLDAALTAPGSSLATTLAVSGTLSAALLTSIRLEADLASTVTVSGTLSTGIQLGTALATGVSLAADLTVGLTFDAALSIDAAITAALTTGLRCTTALAVTTTVAAGLTTAIRLATTQTIATTLTATLTSGNEVTAIRSRATHVRVTGPTGVRLGATGVRLT